MNDLLLQIKSPILAYADDIKIYSKIATIDDAIRLQHNLDIMVDWCERSKLKLNIAKCCVVAYSRSSAVCNFSYKINGNRLEYKSEMKDLGVLFDSSLTYKSHIMNVCSDAFKALGFVMRVSKYFKDISLIKSLYFSYVLSKIEYAALIWHPIYACEAIALDRVHRRFLKFLSFKIDGVYPERGISQEELLLRHNIRSLNTRRDDMTGKIVCKLIKNQIDCPFLLHRMSFLIPRMHSRYEAMFMIPFARTNIMKRTPVYIMSRVGNRFLDNVFD